MKKQSYRREVKITIDSVSVRYATAYPDVGVKEPKYEFRMSAEVKRVQKGSTYPMYTRFGIELTAAHADTITWVTSTFNILSDTIGDDLHALHKAVTERLPVTALPSATDLTARPIVRTVERAFYWSESANRPSEERLSEWKEAEMEYRRAAVRHALAEHEATQSETAAA